ncbi:MAG: DUF5684 domain-containing protein [Clostridium sp.]|nr:DUF5684 domain-containing protein [Clostridium sp.]
MSYNYDYNPAAAGFLAMFTGVYLIVALVICVLLIVACWRIYAKAGEPGWASLVPFYSNYVLFKIAFGNGWLFLLMFVPIVNIVVSIMLIFKLAKAFGQGVGFGFGLLFLSPIFLLILAFGSSEYEGV